METNKPAQAIDPELTYFIMIGNSDDELTQREWGSFLREMRNVVESIATQIYGMWYSAPDVDFQNACFSFAVQMDVDTVMERIAWMREMLQRLAGKYRQHSIALAATLHTEFIQPTTLDRVIAVNDKLDRRKDRA